MPISGTFYTSQELIKLLGVSKSRVSNLAREQGFKQVYPGLWDAWNVDAYLLNRQRTELLKAAGWWPHKGLCLWGEVDTNCPECEEYAVYKPYYGTDEERSAFYSDNWPWRCIKGHSSPDNTHG